MIWQTFAMALRQIRSNAMRSFLTMPGVITGVGSVIGMVTIGNGATAKVQSDIGAMGQNMLIIMPGADPRGGFHPPDAHRRRLRNRQGNRGRRRLHRVPVRDEARGGDRRGLLDHLGAIDITRIQIFGNVR
jgi:putative ABC transport system permease protein